MDISFLKGKEDAQYWLLNHQQLKNEAPNWPQNTPNPPHWIVNFEQANVETIQQDLKTHFDPISGPGLAVAVTKAENMAFIDDYTTKLGLEIQVRASVEEAEDAVFLYSLEQSFGLDNDDEALA